MNELVVISGKGGTGKTTLTGCFAALNGGDAVLVDADVDAPNLSLITKPQQLESYEFRSSKKAIIDTQKCSACGLCLQLCRFKAILESYCTDPLSCEGCGVCSRACPERAIAMQDVVSGHWFVSQTSYGKLVHARLGVAEQNSGKMVTVIREKAKKIAAEEKKRYLIIDGPPGIGCPVIASLGGVDAALVITEPTLSGIHDLERVISVCRHFQIPAAVCINRFDLYEENTRAIEEYCQQESIELVAKIPFDRAFVEATARGVPVVEYTDGPVYRSIKQLWEKITAVPD